MLHANTKSVQASNIWSCTPHSSIRSYCLRKSIEYLPLVYQQLFTFIPCLPIPDPLLFPCFYWLWFCWQLYNETLWDIFWTSSIKCDILCPCYISFTLHMHFHINFDLNYHFWVSLCHQVIITGWSYLVYPFMFEERCNICTAWSSD